MKRIEQNGVPIYRFALLDEYDGLDHAVFTRMGGVSSAPYDRLNTALQVGDDPGCAMENRRIIEGLFKGRAMVFARQVHGNRVAWISQPPSENADHPPVADALVTDAVGLALTIQVADCQSVMIYDPGTRAIANIHNGWRGSIVNVIGETVDFMVRTFDCRPVDMVAGIGPSLGPCCAEFIRYRDEIPERFWEYKDRHDHFDFWAISHDQLRACGLRPDGIEISRLCTRCRPDLFFSYRHERQTGRFATVIARRPHNANTRESTPP